MIHYLLDKLELFLKHQKYWDTDIVLYIRKFYWKRRLFFMRWIAWVETLPWPHILKLGYKIWIIKHETLDAKKIKNDIRGFLYNPTITIVMPVFHTPLKLLEKAIQSIEQQLYTNWELCIADGGCDKKVAIMLQKYCKNNSRIKLISLKKNLGISGNSNSALSLATGEYIALMDHDDMIPPNALYEIARLLQKHPEADLIYTDSDFIQYGIRSHPFFKPDWSPDLLLSQNYICHLSVFRHRIVSEIGGFREEFDGAQDYDLILRFVEKTDAIFHIPKVLYHWRQWYKSMSHSQTRKCIDAGRRAIIEAMKRRQIEIRDVEVTKNNTYLVRYQLIGTPLITIIIPTKDKLELLKKCISSILERTTYENYEIIVVDNRSEEKKTFDYFSEIVQNNKIRVIEYNAEFNYSAINNYAMQYTQGGYLVFLNNDTEVITPDWLQGMLELCQRKEVGAVGVKLLYPNNTLQHVGVVLGLWGLAGHVFIGSPSSYSGYFYKNNCIHNLSAVTAACLMTKKGIFQEVEGFNEKDLPVAFNDVDLCLKIRQKGYLVLYTPNTELYHHESASRGHDTLQSERVRNEIDFMQKKWHKVILDDPYYNINLTKTRPDYTIEI